MGIYKRWLPAIFSALMVSILATIWIVFAPVQIGGQAGYIIITGNSMEPLFHTGDLVIVRRAPIYGIGTAVAYKNAILGRVVFHRIIDQELDRFIFKGDNNTWTDSYKPTQAELIGELWIHLSLVGNSVLWARQPSHVSVFAGVLVGFIFITILRNDRRRGQRRMRPRRLIDLFKRALL